MTGGPGSGGGPAVDRPIFVVGPHRSGTTLLYNVLCRHPDVAFISRTRHRFRKHPLLGRVLEALGHGTEPHEAQQIWDEHWKGPDDAMGPGDATPEAVRWHRELADEVTRRMGRKRFLAKYPRLSLRLGWLDAVFPGCHFVHIHRDWRAVVHSTLKKKKQREKPGHKGGWYGVRIPGWEGLVDATHAEAAARQYRHVTLTLEREGPAYGNRFRRVSYQELCAEPRRVVAEILRDCELPVPDAMIRSFSEQFASRDFKWKEGLDPALVEALRAEDPESFARWEFD